jgi:predicted ribosomally synthesized peptide with SipW-like signal peptide
MAVLAGGLVLGVGAAITLAAWNDSEFATGDFASGSFGIQGSDDGTTFGEHPSGAPATLTFEVGADLLSPSSTVYSLFSVKLLSTSDYAAALGLTSVGAGTIAPAVTNSIADIAGTTCDAAAFSGGTVVVPASTPATQASSLPLGSLSTLAEQQNYCIAVTTSGALTQGQSGSITWEFTGTSTTPLP